MSRKSTHDRVREWREATPYESPTAVGITNVCDLLEEVLERMDKQIALLEGLRRDLAFMPRPKR